MRFEIGLFDTNSGEEFGCWVEIDKGLAHFLLRYKSLVEIIGLPFVSLVVGKPDPARPLIAETEWPRTIGLEEFAIKPSGVHLNVLDESGHALGTEAIRWEFLMNLVAADSVLATDYVALGAKGNLLAKGRTIAEAQGGALDMGERYPAIMSGQEWLKKFLGKENG